MVASTSTASPAPSGSKTTLVPFWQRIPKFFQFPFHPSILLVLGGLSAASLLIPLLPVPSPVDLALGEGMIWLAALRHAFQIMEKTSQGYLSPDQYPFGEPDPERVNLPWKLLAVLFVWGMMVGLVTALSRTLGSVAGWLFSFAMPAVVMTLSATNSMAAAVNPARCLSTMRGVGKPYIALFVFLGALSSGGEYVLPLVAPLVPEALLFPLFNFVFLYFNMVMFVMMGYALYQFHADLDVDIEVSHFQQTETVGGARRVADPVGDVIAEMIAAGDMQGALDVAYEEQRTNPDKLPAQERYHQMLVMAGKRDRALSHGQHYLVTLMRMSRHDQALGLFKRLRELDEKFQPEATEHILMLARAAVKARDPALALNLVRAFDKRFPGHRDIPAVYLLSAQILSDSYRKDDLAQAVLAGMLKKYPDHALAEEASTLLKVLQTLAAKSAPAVAPGTNSAVSG